MTIALVKSPWVRQLKELAGSARHRMTMVAPYITSGGWDTVMGSIANPDDLEINVCTSLNYDAVVNGYLDISALAKACETLPNFNLRHIAQLHAKIYIADTSSAIVTSGNLTGASLTKNHEYGVWISDPTVVNKVRGDIDQYTSLGVATSCVSLRRIAKLASELRSVALNPESDESELADEIRRFTLKIRELRGDDTDTRHAVFMRTIIYLLGSEPLSTREMQPLIQNIHPDLCDDEEDRMINGVSFGKRWKHDVRNAQVTLKRQGRINNFRGEHKWHLT